MYTDEMIVDSKTGIGIITIEDKKGDIKYPVVTLKFSDEEYAMVVVASFDKLYKLLTLEDIISKKFEIKNEFKCRINYRGRIHIHLETYKKNKDVEALASNVPKMVLNDKIFLQYADLDNTVNVYKGLCEFIKLYKKYGYYFIVVEISGGVVLMCNKDITIDVDLYDMGMDILIKYLLVEYERGEVSLDKENMFYSWSRKLSKFWKEDNYIEVKRLILRFIIFIQKKSISEIVYLKKDWDLYSLSFLFMFRDGIVAGWDDKEKKIIKWEVDNVFDVLFSSRVVFKYIKVYYQSFLYFDKSDVELVEKVGVDKNIKEEDEKIDLKGLVENILENRKYVLNDNGVRVRIKDNYIREMIIKEREGLVKGYVITTGGYYYPIVNDYINRVGCSIIGDIFRYEDEVEDYYLRKFLESWKELVCEKRYSSRKGNGKTILVDKEGGESGVVYLPIKNVGGSGDYIRKIVERKRPIPHGVSGHLRKGNVSQKQREIAEKFGVKVPDGYTFVKPFRKGK
jgi:hypothetical protein